MPDNITVAAVLIAWTVASLVVGFTIGAIINWNRNRGGSRKTGTNMHFDNRAEFRPKKPVDSETNEIARILPAKHSAVLEALDDYIAALENYRGQLVRQKDLAGPRAKPAAGTAK